MKSKILDNMMKLVLFPVKGSLRDDDVEEEIVEEEPEVSEPKENNRNFVTGDATYVVPDDMRSLNVEIQESNGAYVNDYTLTKYITIKPGQRIRIRVNK